MLDIFVLFQLYTLSFRILLAKYRCALCSLYINQIYLQLTFTSEVFYIVLYSSHFKIRVLFFA